MKTLLLAATAAAVLTGANPAPAMADATKPVSQVVQWNQTLLVIVRTPGAQPATVHPTRSFAIMHAAIYDAVNAIDSTHKPYLAELSRLPRSASQDGAAAAAAHEVLLALYPAFQTALDAVLQLSLAQIPDGKDKLQGVTIGQTVAELTSDTFTDAFNEVKSLGIVKSTTASADQALTGHFWNGAIQNYWNEIAQTASVAHNLTTAQYARLFALLNLTLADGVIAFYDTKYTYNFWRPVTAIRAADTDNNPDTAADPNWLPQVGNTTPDPSYPGAHAVISAAAARVLTSFFKTNHFNFNVTSEVLPGVQRSFSRISDAAEEATLSRIFAGVHFRFDLTTGQRLGREVADFVVDNLLTPTHEEDNSHNNK